MCDLLAVDTHNIESDIYGFRVYTKAVHVEKSRLAYFPLLNRIDSFKGCSGSAGSSVFYLDKDQCPAFIIHSYYIKLRLTDTAGVRETDDIVEGMGVRIAEKLMESSELIIAVFDGGRPLTADDLHIINKINNKKSVAVINKNDVGQQIDMQPIKDNFIHIVYVSAKENSGMNDLKSAIEDIFKINESSLNSVSAANERQKRCIERALEYVEKSISAIGAGELLDPANVLLEEAEQSLLELTGKRITNAVVDETFSRFCVGK